MAFSAQMPNNSRLEHRNWRLTSSHKGYNYRNEFNSELSMYSFTQKLGQVTPSLCFQADVFYPNAIADVMVHRDNFGRTTTTSEGGGIGDQPNATGCRGHQIQRDFPLESRLPVAVPLVQYPSPTSPLFMDQMDICAAPVIHWEQYVERYVRTSVKGSAIDRQKSRLKREKAQSVMNVENPIPTSASEDEDEQGQGDVDDGSQQPKLRLREKIASKYNLTNKSNITTVRDIRKKLFEESKKGKKGNKGKEKPTTEKKSQLESAKEILKKFEYQQKNIKMNKYKLPAEEKISRVFLDATKTIPPFRLEATWNYVYGGSLCHTMKSGELKLFVGNRSQIRKVDLEKSSRASFLSYRVGSIWEEDAESIPKNKRRQYIPQKADHPLDDVVLEIIHNKDMNLLGARRGKVIGIYGIDESQPYLLDEIPNTGYGGKWYPKSGKHVEDPVLLGMDFNPFFTPEIISIDENMQLRVCDFTRGQTMGWYGIPKRTRRAPRWPEFPRLSYINDAAGVKFRKDDGHVFYGWSDSQVILGDRRDNSLVDIFDLRRSISSLSWSDQMCFNDSYVELNEYMSSLRPSNKDGYFYVGTTSRILLMDVRVPGQPVLKMEHGMPVAAYLDTYFDFDFSYEILAAGSQRLGKTFIAITDHAHVQCSDRPDCRAINPVLHCLPRHVSSSNEFYETVSAAGFDPTREADHERAKAHNVAWTTGLTIVKSNQKLPDPRGPPGVLLFTSNCYGDVFYQEFEQSPMERHRKTDVNDPKFKEFLSSWKTSMESKPLTFLRPTLAVAAPEDYSLFVETASDEVKKIINVRSKPVDAVKPNTVIQDLNRRQQPSFEKTLQNLRGYKDDLAQRCLNVWEYGLDGEEDLVTVKEEDDESFSNEEVEVFPVPERVHPCVVLEDQQSQSRLHASESEATAQTRYDSDSETSESDNDPDPAMDKSLREESHSSHNESEGDDDKTDQAALTLADEPKYDDEAHVYNPPDPYDEFFESSQPFTLRNMDELEIQDPLSSQDWSQDFVPSSSSSQRRSQGSGVKSGRSKSGFQ